MKVSPTSYHALYSPQMNSFICCRRVWSCLQRKIAEKAGKKQTRVCCSQDYARYVWQWYTPICCIHV